MSAQHARAAWLVVAACFVCMMVAAGIGWFVFPVFLKAIQADLGWTRSELSFAVAVWAVAGGAFAPLAGTWVDRYGPLRVMTAGTLLQIVTTFFVARMQTPWQLYTLFVLASLANALNTFLPVAATISRWFDERRGTAMAIAMLGQGCGGLVVPIVANLLLERYGWRGAYTIFAYVLVGVLVPILLWVRSPPAPEAEAPAAGEAPEGAPGDEGLTLRQAAGTRSFWTLASGDFLMGVVVTAVIVHMVAFTTDAGVSQTAATAAYGTLLATQIVGILGFGAAADRLPIRAMMVLCYGTTSVAMLFTFRLDSFWLLYVFALIFGTVAGGRAALWPLALGECFGVAHLGRILGWLAIPWMAGNAVGPWLAGYIYDVTHGYRLLFLLCIALGVLSAGLVSRMRRERRHSAESIPGRASALDLEDRAPLDAPRKA